MNKTTLLIAAGLAFITALPASALAYDSQCRNGNTRGSPLNASVCRLPPFASNAKCAEGLDSVRGTQWGEHTWITAKAMKLAGLHVYTDPLAAAADPALDYYTSGITVPGAVVETLEPAWPDAMRKRVKLPITIPEFAQVPDMSYSLVDFLLGNEHCVAENIPRGSLAEIQSCHGFKDHMGPLNSTHFSPQTRSIYNLYHGLALDRAVQCKAIADAFPTGGVPSQLADRVRTITVPACEKEALIYESVASHYLADAWSSGHMWERWGSPIFPSDSTQQKTLVGVALTAGLVHGWRILAEDLAAEHLGDFNALGALVHDQLCMPGAWEPSSTEYLDLVATTFKYPGQTALFRGGGDVYLLGCTGLPANGSQAVATSANLKPQYDRMISCVTRGFQAVYAAGPQTLGPLSASVPYPLIVSSTQDECWAQRATNESMYAAMGVTAMNDDGFDLGNSAVAAVAKGRVTQAGAEVLAQEISDLLRAESLQLRARAKILAEVLPYGTEMATTSLPSHLGWGPNSAYASLIDGDQVAYLEAHDPGGWDVTAVGATCNTDQDCPDRHYCRYGGRCVAMEGANLTAFRKAELATFCELDTQYTIAQAAAECTTYGGDACQACLDIVLPHVRNACDPGSYSYTTSGLDGMSALADHRAPCEVLTAAGVAGIDSSPVYLPYDPNDPNGATGMVQGYCASGAPAPSGVPISYAFEDPNVPPASAVDIDATEALAGGTYQVPRATCGANLGTHWWRFSRAAGPADRHIFKVTTTPLDQNGTTYQDDPAELELKVFQGPACVQEIGQGQVVTQDSTPGSPSWLQATWNVPTSVPDEVCVRVRPANRYVWTGYDFSAEQAPSDTIAWAPSSTVPAGSPTSFVEATQLFPTIPYVSTIEFSPDFSGDMAGYASDVFLRIGLLTDGVWVEHILLKTPPDDSYPILHPIKLAGQTLEVSATNVSGIRFGGSGWENNFYFWFHNFGAGTITFSDLAQTMTSQEAAYSWAPTSVDASSGTLYNPYFQPQPAVSSASDFNQAEQQFPSIPVVSRLWFAPGFLGYAHAHAIATTATVELESNGVWTPVRQTFLATYGVEVYENRILAFPALTNVTGLRFRGSPDQDWTFHRFGTVTGYGGYTWGTGVFVLGN